MKRLYWFLKIAIGTFLGVFVGRSLFQWWHFSSYPNLYAMQSAPWYLSIEFNAVFTALILGLLLIVLYFVSKKARPERPWSLWRLLSLLSCLTGFCTAIWMGFELFGYHTNYDTVTWQAWLIGICLLLNLIFSLIRLYQEKRSH